MQTKTGGYAVTVKNDPAGGMRITGLGSAYSLDLVGDTIAPGAYAKTLKANPSVPLLFGHDPARPIGKTLFMAETPRGLIFEAVIIPTTDGRDAAMLAKAGVMTGVSIGFDAPRTSRGTAPGELRRLEEIKLYELSLVLWPAQPLAKIDTVGEWLADELTVAKTEDRQRRGLPVAEHDLVKYCDAQKRLLDTALWGDRRQEIYKIEYELQELRKLPLSPDSFRTRARQSGRAR